MTLMIINENQIPTYDNIMRIDSTARQRKLTNDFMQRYNDVTWASWSNIC